MTVRGVPWLLSTDAMLRVRKSFIVESRGYVNEMQRRFPVLENYVHGENRLSRRWLTWCGFTIDDTPHLLNGETFFLFRREEPCAP